MKTTQLKSLCLLLAAVAAGACSSGGGKHATAVATAVDTPSSTASGHRLTLPVPPTMLNTDSARLDYVAAHYWQSMDVRDTTWVADTAALEQAYANYLGMLMQLPVARSAQYIAAFHRTTEVCPSMRKRLFAVAERYLYDPNSPMRNEALYIPLLQWAVASEALDKYEKIRPQYQLEMAVKNRPGSVATDFGYTTPSGARSRLSKIQAEYTLLFFYNPDCPDCKRVKEAVAGSAVLAPLLASGRLKVLAVYTDNDIDLWRQRLPQMPQGWTVGYNTELNTSQQYDLRAIPCLYLLDARKHVVLKDAPVEQVEAWLVEK